MGLQKITLRQIASNMTGAANFEDQLVKMRSSHEDKFVTANGQTTFTLSLDYTMGGKQLSVYLNGMRLSLGDDYTETNSRMITLTEATLAGDTLLVRINGDMNAIVNNKADLFEIHRESFITNTGQVSFTTSQAFVMGGTSLEIFRDGMLLEMGSDKDYVELTNNSFKLNEAPPTGTVITVKIFTW